MPIHTDNDAIQTLHRLSTDTGIPIKDARIRRSSSRFCLGVEHGDYNGTELFGVGTDRFIWMAYTPRNDSRIQIFSGNFPGDGIIDFGFGDTPLPRSPDISDTWARFIYGVDFILLQEGVRLQRGMDAVLIGNIPGGGMSRSASLTLNLLLSLLDCNGIEIEDRFKIVDMAQAVENDYIGSPCGQLDQIMILFAQEGKGTHYNPRERTIEYIEQGEGTDFRLVSLDTGTVRPGLEKSTYSIRRAECEEFVSLLREKYQIEYLADIRDREKYDQIFSEYGKTHPGLCSRFKYIFEAQQRFYIMLEAWKEGDIPAVGTLFREDGFGLRDDYQISGPELETMCDIARTVDGVYGERMLGGGDKGASGAICHPDAVATLENTVGREFPKIHPPLKDKYAVHPLKAVDGITLLEK
ncbi:galactokinase [Acidobacteriota bacterium]